AAGLDVERAVLRRDRDELAAEVGDLLLPEEPARALEPLPAEPVAVQGGDGLGLDVVADLEVRHRDRLLVGDDLRLEDAAVALDGADLEEQPPGPLLRLLLDPLALLDLEDLVLEHPRRAVRVDPD